MFFKKTRLHTLKIFHFSPSPEKILTNSRLLLNTKMTSSFTSRNFATDPSSSGRQKEEVLLESRNGKGIIIINRPEFRNTLSISVGKSLLEKIRECQSSKSMIIIRGQGDKAFCAGGEVLPKDSPPPDLSVPWEGFRYLHSIFATTHSLQIPCIALLNGITMGGGLSLAISGRYRIATENTLCSMPETLIGYYPNAGAAYFLPKLRKNFPFGLFLGLTGERIKGSDNLHAGIATHFCSSSMLSQLEGELIEMDSTRTANPIEVEKIFRKYTDACPDSRKPFSLEGNLSQIEKHFSRNSVEEIIASLEQDTTEWAKNVLQTLRRMSPTALKITFKHFKDNHGLDLNQCLALDVGLSHRCIQGPDFFEGIRALLISKDGKPRWNPGNLKDVSDSYIQTFFEPLPPEQQFNLGSKL